MKVIKWKTVERTAVMVCKQVRVAPQLEQAVRCFPLKRLRARVERRAVGNRTVWVMGETQGDGSFFPL